MLRRASRPWAGACQAASITVAPCLVISGDGAIGPRSVALHAGVEEERAVPTAGPRWQMCELPHSARCPVLLAEVKA